MKKYILILFFLAGCNQHQSSIRWQPTDPNRPVDNIPWPTELTGSAADKIAEVLAANTRDEQGRRNMLIEALLPYYIILFLIGLSGIGACILLHMLRIPIGRFLWIVPVVSFGGMAFIHFWSDYARLISLIFGGICLGILVWKLVEWKWERNKNYEKLKLLEK